ncbi:MAG: glycoside hydrolase family 2 protein [Caldilineaceae bacterium]|nr:glycoside hydrolase family 2 protein [Caldilineaceae bacterium]MBP8108888.1 glycoside hydrolase family 2 protein [Caldilineaceae bacterium]MBP8122927.1 glycoside hydrolase family 2 protein [Caldilineaceae bacterium]MBP9073051.1 glycoside hydrolase family 2 protein [Caldilineaceae bacterium]
MKIQSLTGAWQFRQADTEAWLPATVPGGVHTDLLALDRIPDPFVGDNERRVAWVAEADWDYRHQFAVTADLLNQPHIWLVCDGLDTLATVELNGQTLGQTDNMFRQYRWDVKPLLKTGENELCIAFASPVGFVTAQQSVRPLPGVSQAIPGGPHLRKAPCQFGWDWGPQLPPIGVWKDVRLEAFGVARLADVNLQQRHDGGEVTVEVEAGIERFEMAADPLALSVTITAPDGSVIEQTAEISETATVSVPIPHPQLWWPNGWGDQPLYSVRVRLSRSGVILDEKDYQLGLRTIELRQEPDEWGRSFTFVVNGQPIFAKGSNWIPADSFPTRISDAYLEGLIRAAVETHQNMLRVWGGGFYEEERFYDLCDRYGILVWQDFIFSCSIYPLDDPEFVENVRVEVVENIRRLRHRASLALWCGNNEMEWGWESWGWAKHPMEDQLPALVAQFPALGSLLASIGKRNLLEDWEVLQNAYKEFFHTTLAKWTAEFDPATPYWPSSPSSNTPFNNVNGQIQGDAHYWDVWHGRKPFTAYRDQYPRFMSEFGFQALPPLETIRTYAAEADWNMTSYIMEQHQKNDSGNSLMVGQMLDTFRLPKDFDSLVYLSMVLQAEGIRYGVEHWRRHTQRVSGTLYWQLNDCWPVASWSSLDYFGRWKALHYAARRFFAPLLLSIEDAPPRQSIFLSSDLLEAWQGSVQWALTTLDGAVLTSGEKAVQVDPLGVTAVEEFDFSEFLDDDTRRDLVFVAELWQGDQRLTVQTALFAPTKHVSLVDPQINADVTLKDDLLTMDLSTHSLARLVECSLTGVDVVFSDNYFDLPAQKAIRITAPLPAGWDLGMVQAALNVRSVYNTYAK